MSVIVSANYRDRAQKNWLVRQASDSIETYELRDCVVIKNFRFCESFSGEVGFGCNVVAVGESAEEFEVDREKLVRLRFTGLAFVEHDSDASVEGGRVLVLDATGMYYLPA